jgi:hypothetical protein
MEASTHQLAFRIVAVLAEDGWITESAKKSSQRFEPGVA